MSLYLRFLHDNQPETFGINFTYVPKGSQLQPPCLTLAPKGRFWAIQFDVRVLGRALGLYLVKTTKEYEKSAARAKKANATRVAKRSVASSDTGS